MYYQTFEKISRYKGSKNESKMKANAQFVLNKLPTEELL